VSAGSSFAPSYSAPSYSPKHRPLLLCVRSLPGARRHGDLLTSFARILPELLRFSSSSEGTIRDDDEAPPKADMPRPATATRRHAARSVEFLALGKNNQAATREKLPVCANESSGAGCSALTRLSDPPASNELWDEWADWHGAPNA